MKKQKDLEDENFELLVKNNRLQFKVWALDRMVHNLLESLNDSESMRKQCEDKGLPRI